MSDPLLLDTCAAIWLVNGDRISEPAKAAIAAAQRASAGLYVSPISAWEIATLAGKGRLVLNQPAERWFARLLTLPGMRLADMSPDVLIASASLPGAPPKDPADRIIAATARTFALTLVTRDGELLPYGRAGHLSVIEC